MIIIFDWTVLLLVILLLVLGVVGVSASIIINLLVIICIMAFFKNILQDFYFALVKYRKKFSVVLIAFFIDCVRILSFYKLIYYSALSVSTGMGIELVGGIFNYVMSVIIGGFFFMMGEINAIAFGMKEPTSKMSEILTRSVFFCGGLIVLCFILI